MLTTMRYLVVAEADVTTTVFVKKAGLLAVNVCDCGPAPATNIF
jgi:hypothetical protein